MLDKLLNKRNEYLAERNRALEYAAYCKIKVEVLDELINELEQEAQPNEEVQPVEEVQPNEAVGVNPIY